MFLLYVYLTFGGLIWMWSFWVFFVLFQYMNTIVIKRIKRHIPSTYHFMSVPQCAILFDWNEWKPKHNKQEKRDKRCGRFFYCCWCLVFTNEQTNKKNGQKFSWNKFRMAIKLNYLPVLCIHWSFYTFLWARFFFPLYVILLCNLSLKLN